MKKLTDAELKVMNILWKLGKGFTQDILNEWNHPKKLSYNTISTMLRRMVTKDIVGINAYGKNHQYYPKFSKAEYQKFLVNDVVSQVFSGSMFDFISTAVGKEKLSEDEINELKNIIGDHD